MIFLDIRFHIFWKVNCTEYFSFLHQFFNFHIAVNRLSKLNQLVMFHHIGQHSGNRRLVFVPNRHRKLFRKLFLINKSVKKKNNRWNDQQNHIEIRNRKNPFPLPNHNLADCFQWFIYLIYFSFKFITK